MNNSHAHLLKINSPCRNQMEMKFDCLDALLPQDHLARSVWAFVEAIDSRPCFSHVKTFFGSAGRSTACPKMLFALWLYSILDGNISARKLAELCKNHDAYKWLAGNVPTNRTMLAEFRSNDPIKFDDLLTNCLAVMLKAGLIDDTDFSQDGTRIKANAGTKSFKTLGTLQELEQEIRAYIKNLPNEELAKDELKKKKRIACERLDRVKEAIKIIDKEKCAKEENKKKITIEQLKKSSTRLKHQVQIQLFVK